jgi:hypothetical protein
MKANGIIGNHGTTPASFDSSDWRLTFGTRWKGDDWSIDGAFGYVFEGSRHIPASQAIAIPGEYDSKPAYLLSILLTRRF